MPVSGSENRLEWPVRCRADVDLGVLENNIRALRGTLPTGCRYISVVKADAYGHGLSRVAERLSGSGLADLYAVASLEEAAEVRRFDTKKPVLMLGALFPGEEERHWELGLTPTLSSKDEIERLERTAARLGRTLAVHLKVDTGMGRLGVWYRESAPLYQMLSASKHLLLRGIYTHLSSADCDPEFTELQRRRFRETLSQLPGLDRRELLVHADNSAGFDSFAEGCGFNAVRVGIAQYGVLPFAEATGRLRGLSLTPVCSLHSRVSLVKVLPAGTDISYGRTCRLERKTRVAVVAAGYGDGVPVARSNRGAVLIRGERCPLLGRVTMDEIIVDTSGLPEVAVGDLATLFGRQGEAGISVREYGEWCRTIPWEALCSLTQRVPRVYRQ